MKNFGNDSKLLFPSDGECITVHTDGSCYHVTRKGGWAFYARKGNKCLTKFGYDDDTTVNRMELIAVINALEFLLFTPEPIEIFTDSNYTRNALTVHWRIWQANDWITRYGEPVKNRDLIERGVELIHEHRAHRKLDIHWIKGHNGNRDNERVDKLAHNARVRRETNWTKGNH